MKLQDVLAHPGDIWPLARMAYMLKFNKVHSQDPGLAFCYDMLRRVSRSFALVIQQLPQPLRDAVCVFYLVLRALDTEEDDMAVPVEEKVPMLRTFHRKIYDRSFKTSHGTGHYADLMQQYPLVTDVFLSLDKGFQDVIADITKRMGNGMADFIEKEVITVEDYDLYCHYVAGLVGIGLSQLFSASGREDAALGQEEELANHMGLFLQKTNIIRDYLEDINEEPAPRMFWPRDVWSKHAKSLADFKEQRHARAAVSCLDELVTDAMRHAPYCLDYCKRLRDPQIFKFCALPQVMAIGTLAMCYDNHGVFTGVVKMRRGEVARLTLGLQGVADVYRAFQQYDGIIAAKARSLSAGGDAATRRRLLKQLEGVDAKAAAGLREVGAAPRSDGAGVGQLLPRLLVLLAALLYFTYAFGHRAIRQQWLGQSGSGSELMDAVNMVAASFLLLGASFNMLAGGQRVGQPGQAQKVKSL